MKRAPLTVALILSALAAAQSVRYIPNLAVAESEYRNAQEAWLKNDPDLEQDLYKHKREEMLRRIHLAAGLRDDVMAKKEVYLGFLMKRFDEIRARLEETKGGNVPTAPLKTDLDREQTRLLSEQERLEALIHDLPPGDEYALVRRSMELERADLISLQNNIAMRMRSLDKTAAEQQAESQYSRDSLEDKLDELKKIWEGERVRAVRARAGWARYYKDLELSLDPNYKAGRESAPSPAAPTTTPGATPTPPPAPSAPMPAFTGSWAYRSQPGAWVGFGEPESVILQLHKNGGNLEGVYIARLPGRTDVRLLKLTLRGRQQSDRQVRLQWTSEKPFAHGEINLKLSPDGRLLVQRLNSDDSYIPKGMEVLLRQ